MTISIAFACDENYALQLAVAICSIIDNANQDTQYDIHVLVPNNFKNELKEKIEKLFDNNQHEITFYPIINSFENVVLNIEHITVPTYYRLLLPSILPNVDKIIYLDVDVIVKIDLSQLYVADIKDSYAAAVIHPVISTMDNQTKLLKIDYNPGTYFNAGVMLFNLRAIRENNLEQAFFKLVPKNFGMQDQDILNIVFYEKVVFLPFRYNVMIKCLPIIHNEEYTGYYKKEEIIDAFKHPVIIHYNDYLKPWNSEYVPYFESWIFYFNKSPFFDEELLFNESIDLIAHRYVDVFQKNFSNAMFYSVYLDLTRKLYYDEKKSKDRIDKLENKVNSVEKRKKWLDNDRIKLRYERDEARKLAMQLDKSLLKRSEELDDIKGWVYDLKKSNWYRLYYNKYFNRMRGLINKMDLIWKKKTQFFK